MLYIIRHGQTAMNKAKALQGRSDSELNETGRAEAAAAGELFKEQGVLFDRVFTSPLKRAAETARIIAGSVPAEADARLIEMDYGPYEGMDLTNPAPEVLDFFRDFVNTPAPEGMEQLRDVTGRLGSFLGDLKQRVSPVENVLVSTHAIAMKGALEYLTPSSNGAWWSRYIGNCAIFAVELRDGCWSVPAEWGVKSCNEIF